MGDLLILLSAVLFGFSPILIKVAYSYGVTPLTVLALRYAIATILFWGGVAVLGVRLRFPRHAILALVAMGLTLVPVQIFSFLLALAYLPASSASVLAYVYPLHVAWMGWVFLRERIRWEEVALLVAVVTGAMLVAGQTPVISARPGLVAISVATLSNALYYIAARRMLRDILPLPAQGILLAAGAAVFVSAGAMTGRLSLALPLPALLAIFGTAVLGSLLAPLLLLGGLRVLPAARAAMLGTVEPVVTVLLSILWLGDRVSFIRAVGMALVLVGIGLAHVRRPL